MHTNIAEANLEIQRLKAQLGTRTKRLSIKVSEKGGVCVSGLQRFPTTLYANQWETLLAHKEDILAFIEANKNVLAVKE